MGSCRRLRDSSSVSALGARCSVRSARCSVCSRGRERRRGRDGGDRVRVGVLVEAGKRNTFRRTQGKQAGSDRRVGAAARGTLQAFRPGCDRRACGQPRLDAAGRGARRVATASFVARFVRAVNKPDRELGALDDGGQQRQAGDSRMYGCTEAAKYNVNMHLEV